TAPVPQAFLETWAKAAMVKSELAKVSGSIKFQGSAKIKPGSLLEIAGLGKRFNGSGYVGAVTHLIEKGNWTTEASLGISPDWFASNPDISSPSAAGLLPPVRGLQNGVVKKIHEDPDGEFRV